jgi:hypothetical protein
MTPILKQRKHWKRKRNNKEHVLCGGKTPIDQEGGSTTAKSIILWYVLVTLKHLLRLYSVYIFTTIVDVEPGLKNPAEFYCRFHCSLFQNFRKPVESGRSEFRNRRFTVHWFKISKKDKSQQKICKKTRSNSKVTSEEIFVKPSRLDW